MNNKVAAKKVYLQTWGCQMNEYDTELVKAILAKENYSFVDDELEADIVMLNTCAIREHAHNKVYNRVHNIRHKRSKFYKLNKPHEPYKPVMIGLLGCMVTNLRQELLEDKKLNIDFIAGPDSYKRLPNLIREAQETGRKAFDVTLSEFETYSDILPARKEGVNPSASLRANAWIAVSRGCNNFCTFCVVPYTRGRERSRAPENILQEVRHLAQEGFRQVTLLGQNVNSYKYENYDFSDLIQMVSKVNGIERIRFTSPHPKDFPDKLLNVVAQNPKVCKHIHLPLQAGNNRILDIMNRTYTQEEFLALVDKIRSLCPEIALTTDVIVGFSSETDEEFEDTVKVMERVEFNNAFIFKYSERQGTIASKKCPDNVPEEKKTERIMRLNEIQRRITFKRNQAHIGRTLRVLVEESKSGGDLPGRADNNTLVIFPSKGFKIGDFADVKITGATPHALRGIALDGTPPRHGGVVPF